MRRVLLAVAAVVVAGNAGMALGAVDRVMNGVVRDFKGSFASDPPFAATPGGHPHFEIFTFNSIFSSRIPAGFPLITLTPQIDVVEPGIVGSTLGTDGKPVWLGGSGAEPQAPFHTTKTRVSGNNLVVETDDNVSRGLFNEWYNDTPGVNLSAPIQIPLSGPDNNGMYTYSNANFFPIDNQLFGNEGRAHNQHFTVELHDQVTYVPGQTVTLTAGDDLWLFVNGQLALDMGGVHRALTRTYNLDSLGLTAGQTYPLDIFYAERNTFGADFWIQTNIPLGVVPEAGVGWMIAGVMAVAGRRGRR